MNSSPTLNALFQNSIGTNISGSAQVISAGRDVVVHGPSAGLPVSYGESVLAQTIVEHYAVKGRFLGSLSFPQGGGGLSYISRLIPTLAEQISLSIPSTKPLLKKGDEPAILELSVELSVSVAYHFTTSKSLASKKLTTAKSPKKEASRAGGKKVAGARTPKSTTKGASVADSKKVAGAKVASKTSTRKSTSKIASPTKEAAVAKKVAGALAKPALKKNTVSGGKGSAKEIASPQNLKKGSS